MYNKKKVALLIVILLLILGGIGYVIKKLVFSGTGNGKGPAIKIEEQQKKKKPKKDKKEKTQENSEESNKKDNEVEMEVDMSNLDNEKDSEENVQENSEDTQENEESLKDPAASVQNLSESKDRDRLTDLIETIFTNNVKEYWKGKYEGSYEESIGTDGKTNFTFYLYCSDKETEYLNSLMADAGSFNKYWDKELKNFSNFTSYMNKYYLINASLKVKTPDGSANMVEAENGKLIYDFAETLNRKPKESAPKAEEPVQIEGIENAGEH